MWQWSSTRPLGEAEGLERTVRCPDSSKLTVVAEDEKLHRPSGKHLASIFYYIIEQLCSYVTRNLDLEVHIYL